MDSGEPYPEFEFSRWYDGGRSPQSMAKSNKLHGVSAGTFPRGVIRQ